MKRYLFFLAAPLTLTLTIQTHAQWALLQFTDSEGQKLYQTIRVDQKISDWIAYLESRDEKLCNTLCAWGKKSPDEEEINWAPFQPKELDMFFIEVVKANDALHPQTLFDRKKLEQLEKVINNTVDMQTREAQQELFPWYTPQTMAWQPFCTMWVLDEQQKAVSLRDFATISDQERAELPQPVDFFALADRPSPVGQVPPAPPASKKSVDGGSNNYTKYIVIGVISVAGLLAFVFRFSGTRSPKSAAYGSIYGDE